MIDEPDPDLVRLFAELREPLTDDGFMAYVLLKIERARRARLRRQILAAALAVIIVSFNMRLMWEMTATAARFAGEFASHAELLITPWGWTVSMLIGAWVVLRTRPSRR